MTSGHDAQGSDRGALQPIEDVSAPVEEHRAGVLTRDFVTFAGKLLLNASIEIVLLPLAGLAYAADMIRRTPSEHSMLYAVMKAGRRWDLWLRIFRPASKATPDPQSLGKSAAAGADQLIASLEQMIASGELPSRYRSRVQEWAAAVRPGDLTKAADPQHPASPTGATEAGSSSKDRDPLNG